MPLVVNIEGDGMSSLEGYGIHTAADLVDAELAASERLRAAYPEFPKITDLHEMLIRERATAVFGESS